MQKRGNSLWNFCCQRIKVTIFSMGCASSLCTFRRSQFEEQYEMLVASKPAPISLEKISLDQSDSDPPLFTINNSDIDDAVSDPETLTDEELNLYAGSLNPKND